MSASSYERRRHRTGASGPGGRGVLYMQILQISKRSMPGGDNGIHEQLGTE